MRVCIVIPAFEEAATIGNVLRAIPPGLAVAAIVVDGGSCDATRDVAAAAGARVVLEPRSGYGRACLAGMREAAALGADVVAFLGGGGAEDPADLPKVIGPVVRGEADLALGSRVQRAEPGALRPLQRFGNALATWLIALRFGRRFHDLGSMRALRLGALEAPLELAHGFPAEMQVQALKHGLRIVEVPIAFRRRRGGRSKVSGTVRGTLRAGAAILRVVLTS